MTKSRVSTPKECLLFGYKRSFTLVMKASWMVKKSQLGWCKTKTVYFALAALTRREWQRTWDSFLETQRKYKSLLSIFIWMHALKHIVDSAHNSNMCMNFVDFYELVYESKTSVLWLSSGNTIGKNFNECLQFVLLDAQNKGCICNLCCIK